MLLSIFFLSTFAVLIFFAKPAFGEVDNFNLQVIVTVPKTTPEKDRVFISGNHRLLGNWKSAGALMTKIAPYTYEFNAYLPKAKSIEFKFTRGDFKKIEKSFEGFDIPNRFISLETGGQSIVKCRLECEVEAWKDMLPKDAAVHSYKLNLIGDYKLYKNVESKYLQLKRDVIVWMPEGYSSKENREKRYPVLYMHDGNNLFDARLSFQGVDWGVDEAIDRLVKTKKMKEIIVVGIYNTEARLDEYAPMRDEKRGGGGLGEDYSRFVVEELKPFIDEKFRTLTDPSNTAVGGSSLGGLISLYMGLEYPEVFGGMLVISPALYWDNYSIIPWAMSKGFDNSRNRLWMDMGLLEGRTALRSSRILDGEIRKNYPQFKSYKYREFKDAQHNEAAWRARTLDDDVGPNLALAAGGATIAGVQAANAAAAIDGVHTSAAAVATAAWTSVPPGTLTLDLKGTSILARVRILNPDWTAAAQRYRLEGSRDGATWTTLADAGTEDRRGWDEWAVAAPARYLRFTAISNSAGAAAGLAEWEVFGTPWTKEPAVVVLEELEQVYDGKPKKPRASTMPRELEVDFTFDGSPVEPVAAGTYAVVGTIVDDVYQGSATGTLTILSTTNLFEDWLQSSRGLAPEEPGSGPDDDADGDGATNWDEFLADTDPADPGEVFALRGEFVSAAQSGGETGEIRFTFPASPDRYYQLETCTDLVSGAKETVDLGWGVPGMAVTNRAPGAWYATVRALLQAP